VIPSTCTVWSCITAHNIQLYQVQVQYHTSGGHRSRQFHDASMFKRRFALTAATLVLSGSFLASVWYADQHATSVVYQSLVDFQIGKNEFNNNFRGFKDVLCGGCYQAVAIPGKNIRCGLLILNAAKTENTSVEDAANKIASKAEYKVACARCLPNACDPNEKFYWRYDASPLLPEILSSSVPILGSIPASSRVPPKAMQNLTSFFLAANRQQPPPRFLFHYNPSIVVLPSTFDKSQFTDVPVYAASFRVSTQQSCFYPHVSKALYGGRWDRKPPTQDFLALALLRSDLSIIDDVVVDMKAGKVFQNFAEDFRLFVFREELFVASYDLIAPIHIRLVSHANTAIQGYLTLQNLFPSKLEVSIRQFPSCPACLSKKQCGKNLNYFSRDQSHQRVWVEIWPSAPHIVQEVNLSEPCSVSRRSDPSLSFSDAESNPTTSWHTMEESMFQSMEPSEVLLVRGRGGACCISMEDPRTGNKLLVGIFHTKVPKFGKRSGKRVPLWLRPGRDASQVIPNQYLSRWYGFEPSEPFSVVAHSGLFCLGYPTSIKERETQPLIEATQWKRVVFGGDGLGSSDGSLVLDCPRIHFVSGIAEKDGDPSRILIAYGANDCFSRVIEVSKESIAKLLFGWKRSNIA
jgi:hypothetical protein